MFQTVGENLENHSCNILILSMAKAACLLVTHSYKHTHTHTHSHTHIPDSPSKVILQLWFLLLDEVKRCIVDIAHSHSFLQVLQHTVVHRQEELVVVLLLLGREREIYIIGACGVNTIPTTPLQTNLVPEKVLRTWSGQCWSSRTCNARQHSTQSCQSATCRHWIPC